MEALVTKYRPRRIEDFIGLDRVKPLLLKLVAAPYSSAWLLMGTWEPARARSPCDGGSDPAGARRRRPSSPEVGRFFGGRDTQVDL